MAVSIEARPVPAKATGVSIPHEHKRAKAMTVSDNRTPGRQGQAAEPMGSGVAWPGDQWAANVTNVVKPTRFKSPRENPCYKRRQSKPKNHYFQRKIPRIDDVCNNTHQSTPKTQHARPPMTPTGSGGAWPGFETTHRSATRPRWCGGRRRDRRARLRCPWAVAGPGRASRRCTEQHQRPHPTGVEGAGGPGGHGRASRRSAERSEAA